MLTSLRFNIAIFGVKFNDTWYIPSPGVTWSKYRRASSTLSSRAGFCADKFLKKHKLKGEIQKLEHRWDLPAKDNKLANGPLVLRILLLFHICDGYPVSRTCVAECTLSRTDYEISYSSVGKTRFVSTTELRFETDVGVGGRCNDAATSFKCAPSRRDSRLIEVAEQTVTTRPKYR